uniref:Uncharacterized protein n=1 Tax=Setaria italica TaxID=4555 RepID=K3ZGA8_SETIT
MYLNSTESFSIAFRGFIKNLKSSWGKKHVSTREGEMSLAYICWVKCQISEN